MTATKHWFSAVGESYARNFAEVEFARDRFIADRDAILSHLVSLVPPFHGATMRKEDQVHRTFYVDASDWWELQNKRGKKAQTAGFVLTLGDYAGFPSDGQLAFTAHAFFQAGEGTGNQLQAALRAKGVPHVAYWGCVRLPSFRAVYGESEFSLERFEEAAKALPTFFATTQAVVVAAMAG